MERMNVGTLRAEMWMRSKLTQGELKVRKSRRNLTAKETEQLHRAENIETDSWVWYEMEPKESNEVWERFQKMLEVNREIGIEA